MKKIAFFTFVAFFLAFVAGLLLRHSGKMRQSSVPATEDPVADKPFESVLVPAPDNIRVYCANEDGGISFADAAAFAERDGRRMIAATNGGMYTLAVRPVGLCVSWGKQKAPLKKVRERRGGDNFSLPPNGVLALRRGEAQATITPTKDFVGGSTAWATQSGPMLLIRGEINPEFRRGSKNLALRSGVGVSGRGVHLAISTGKVNFYDFAQYLKRLGCHDALFLDGTVSRLWKKEGQRMPRDRFGVVIAVTEPL